MTIGLALTAQTVTAIDTVYRSVLLGLSADVAQKDIKAGRRPRLFISSGISPVTFVGQEKFEEKYKVKYEENGCTGPPEKEIKDYNKEVFKYLDKMYGRKWRKEVRKDVVGF